MKIDVKIEGTIPLKLEISDIVKEINELPLFEKWSILAQLFNDLNLKHLDELRSDQIIIVRHFLESNLKIYNYENQKNKK